MALGVLLSAAFISSCNMDKYPHDEIVPEITTFSDVEGLRTMHYYYMKGIYTGASMLYGDYGTDYFQPVSNFGNYYSSFLRWSIEPGDGDIEDYWYARYGYINEVNFLIKGIDALDVTNFTNAQKSLVDLYYGEAHFFRAQYYFDLARRFCQKYDSSTAGNANTGLMVLTEPWNVPNNMIPRSTLQEVYDLILADLEVATSKVTTAGKSGNAYLTSDVVKAFKARVALDMGNYTTASTEAAAVIGSGTYSLTSDREAFKGMWAMDNNIDGVTEAWDGVVYSKTQSELLMILEVSNSQDATGTPGRYFMSYTENPGLRPQFFPTKKGIDAFDAENDIRFPAYFDLKTFNISGYGTDDIYFFTKYPGNPVIQEGAFSLYRHKGKPFRLAEMYLVAAEAYYMAGNESEANRYLNELRASRIEGWATTNYSGSTLLGEIQLEKYREFYGEGHRFFDLKRWGLGFSRGDVQSTILVNSNPDLSNVTIEPNNHRFIWPIPKTEIDLNTAMKGQQNPGY